jgi:hypothetical protein
MATLHTRPIEARAQAVGAPQACAITSATTMRTNRGATDDPGEYRAMFSQRLTDQYDAPRSAINRCGQNEGVTE